MRRLLAVAAMLLGALVGALLVGHTDPSAGFFLAAAMAAVVAVSAA